MTFSSRLGLPLLAVGQAQKEITHNEALLLLDLIGQATCEGVPGNEPPVAPALGASYICGADPTGPWSGRANALATWTEYGWRFVTPLDGWSAMERGSGVRWTFRNDEWERGRIAGEQLSIDGDQVVGPRLSAIADPTGGALIDAEVRQAVMQILGRLREHGLIAS